MAYQPIENYGIIGNMRTVALIGMDGSIDWYCYPHFDSPSLFGAILDDKNGGRFQICPYGDQVRNKQFYWPSTNILVTRFLMPDGIAELEDFMPVGLADDSPWNRHVCRRIHCVKGTVRVLLSCRPAFDYGRETHQPPVQIEGRADQRQMGERLWKIAQRFTLCPCLLCIKPEMVGITEHSFEEKHGLIKLFWLSLTRTRQRLYEPK